VRIIRADATLALALGAAAEDAGLGREAYHTCAKPDCPRLVSAISLYCCTPCATAAAAIPPYESVHSKGCEERHETRRNP
jgi:hypothetical protein